MSYDGWQTELPQLYERSELRCGLRILHIHKVLTWGEGMRRDAEDSTGYDCSLPTSCILSVVYPITRYVIYVVERPPLNNENIR
jgi:hypothetical protein